MGHWHGMAIDTNVPLLFSSHAPYTTTPPRHDQQICSIDRLDRPSISCFAFWMFEMMRRTKDSQNGMCPFTQIPFHLHRPARIAFLSIRTTRYFCHKPFASKRRYATTKRQQSLSTALSRYHAHPPSFSPCPRFSNPHRNSHTIQSLVRTKAHTYCHAICTHTRGSQDPKGFRQSGSTP
jgi:hypothetical protein